MQRSSLVGSDHPLYVRASRGFVLTIVRVWSGTGCPEQPLNTPRFCTEQRQKATLYDKHFKDWLCVCIVVGGWVLCHSTAGLSSLTQSQKMTV